MKSELKAKFLQHLTRRKGNQGFTLIELLVVIIIIGILSAIALPAFLNQANKAKQSEAKTNVGSMNRAQQAMYMEKGKFAGSTDTEFGSLGLGINKQTANYTFSIKDGGATGSGTATTVVTFVTNQAQPNVNAIKAYIGGVQQGNVTATSEATTLVVLCESKQPKGSPSTSPAPATGTEGHTASGTTPTCPTTTYDAL
jgi:type IV pilus assembly protein PilA